MRLQIQLYSRFASKNRPKVTLLLKKSLFFSSYYLLFAMPDKIIMCNIAIIAVT
jgi:hypothetical protein